MPRTMVRISGCVSALGSGGGSAFAGRALDFDFGAVITQCI
jgi:hypothetical protein